MTTQGPQPNLKTTSPAEDLLFFSANDLRIDPSDPILGSVPPVGVVPPPKPHPLPDRASRPTDLSVLSALKASPSHMDGGFPISLESAGGGDLLYSFTLPNTKPHPSKAPSVTESFGVLSTQVSRSGTASPRLPLSTTPSVTSDTEHSDYKEQITSSPYSSDLEQTTRVPQIGYKVPINEPPSFTGHGKRQPEDSRDVTPTPELNPNTPPANASPPRRVEPNARQLSQEDTPATDQQSSSQQILPPSHLSTLQQDHPSDQVHSVPSSRGPSITREEPFTPQKEASSAFNLPPSPPTDLELPHPRTSRLDSDIETSSVVSVQQLTEAYLNDPFDSAEEKLTAGASSTIVPVTLPAEVNSGRKSHTPTPSMESKSLVSSNPTPNGAALKASTPLTQKEPSNAAKLPPHIQPSPKVPPKMRHHESSPVEKRSPSLSNKPQTSLTQTSTDKQSLPPAMNKTRNPSLPDGKGSQELKDQLTKALQAKANLEGQLESVVDECKNTLKERAGLQSKLGQAEAQIAELTEALERERKRNSDSRLAQLSHSPDTPELTDHVKEELEDARNALDSEKKEVASAKSELAKEKHRSQQLENDLAEVQASVDEHKEALDSTREKVKDLQCELEKKKNELNEEQSKSSSLEASYGALEETKGWLHQQLQESLEAKMKLQEELREAKANGIAQCIKAEQLMKENASFQDQIGDLQRGVLQDKAQLVSELEAIEADVLSREDSYGHILAEKAQLEDLVKMKANTLDKLNSDLAKTQVEKEELEQKAEDLEMKNDMLNHQVKDLGRSKKSLEGKLQNAERELEGKEADLMEMEKLKAALQERLRDTEASLVGKDGVMQGLNDAREIMRQELEMNKEVRKNVETELEEAKLEVAKLEDELKESLEKNREKDAILRAATQNQQAMAVDKESLSSQLREKDRLLEEKVEQLGALESESGELLNHFRSLQDQFQGIASKSGDVQDSVEEKDRVISHLATEKDNMEEELSSLREKNEQLQGRLAQLQQEKARLEGKMDTSPSSSLEEFQKLLQDKAQLQAEVNRLKMAQQGDIIKAQARADHLESDLKAAKRDKVKATKELQETNRLHEEEVSRLEDENACLKSELRNATSKLEGPVRPNTSLQLQSSLKQAERERNKLKAAVDRLTRENKELADHLEQEVAQKAEIERAGSEVARNLKQNAQKGEKRLEEENQDLALQIEKLRGQLSGMQLTQSAMREHTAGLEVQLSKREAALLKLSAQAQKVLQEKELEDKDVAEKIETLERVLQESKRAHQLAKDKEKEDRMKVAELGRELAHKTTELEELKQELDQLSQATSDTGYLQDQVSELTTEKEDLQHKLSKLVSQLQMSKTAADSLSRELTDKEAQVDILSQELGIAKGRTSQVERELDQVRDQLKAARDRHREEVDRLRRGVGERGQESRAVEGVASGRGLFDASLSTIGADETDHSGTSLVDTSCADSDKTDSSRERVVSELLGHNSLYRAQLAEMGSRLEQARKQGQKVAEIKKSGEISVLQEQLGSKSKTIHGLRSCLSSLKEDMGRLQVDMDRHSASLHASHASTRQIESQIESLRRSSAVPSPLYLSTPTNQSE